MTSDGFDSLWNRLTAKRPLLADPAAKVEITAEQFQRLLRKFYDSGKHDGIEASNRIGEILGKAFK